MSKYFWGKGSYGNVYKYFDNKYEKQLINKTVTLFHNYFDEPEDLDKIKYYREIDDAVITEITILCKLKDSGKNQRIANIIDIKHDVKKNQISLILEYKYKSLKNIENISSINKKNIKIIIHNILLALKDIHDNNIYHLDLKPSNILIKKSSLDIYLCDFSISSPNRYEKRFTTSFIQPPEYSKNVHSEVDNAKVDIWALGVCIHVLILKEDSEFLKFQGCISLLYNNMKKDKGYPYQYGKLKEILGNDGLDLLKKLLEYSFKKRYSVDDALKHPFFKSISFDFNKKTLSNKQKSKKTDEFKPKLDRRNQITKEKLKSVVNLRKEAIKNLYNKILLKKIKFVNLNSVKCCIKIFDIFLSNTVNFPESFNNYIIICYCIADKYFSFDPFRIKMQKHQELIYLNIMKTLNWRIPYDIDFDEKNNCLSEIDKISYLDRIINESLE